MEQPGTLPSGDFPVRGCRGQIRAYIKEEGGTRMFPIWFFHGVPPDGYANTPHTTARRKIPL